MFRLPNAVDLVLNSFFHLFTCTDGQSGFALKLVEHGFNVLGGLIGLFCKFSDLISNDSETSAMFSCPGRFYGRIKGQEVGLGSDTADHITGFLDLDGAGVGLTNHLNDFVHSLLTACSFLCQFLDDLDTFFSKLTDLDTGLLQFTGTGAVDLNDFSKNTDIVGGLLGILGLFHGTF